MLVRRNSFHHIGGFDTAYTNGYEDTDLCLRAGDRGLEVHYCHQSVLIHLQSATRRGRTEEESRNVRLYMSRWGGTEPDDVRYYVQDNLLRFEYGPFYPLSATVSPRLVAVRVSEPDGRPLAAEPVGGSPERHLTPLIYRERTEMPAGLGRRSPAENGAVPRPAPPIARGSE